MLVELVVAVVAVLEFVVVTAVEVTVVENGLEAAAEAAAPGGVAVDWGVLSVVEPIHADLYSTADQEWNLNQTKTFFNLKKCLIFGRRRKRGTNFMLRG